MASVTNTGITISSTDSLSSGQKIFIAAAKEAYEPAAPDPDLISSERMPAGHKQWDILTYARLSDATALTEGVDMTTVQQLYANYLSITPTEHGVIVTLSKRAVTRQPGSLETQAGRQMGVSMRARQAKDVIALYDGFSKSVGGAGTTLDITHFRGAVAYLLTDNDTEFGPAPMPLRMSAHSEMISDLILDLTDAGSRVGGVEDGLSSELVQRWWRGADRAYGVQVFHSAYITADSSTDDAKGGLFAQEALHMVLEGNDESTREIDESRRTTEYGLFKSWGEAERADPHGVEMLFDAAATV